MLRRTATEIRHDRAFVTIFAAAAIHQMAQRGYHLFQLFCLSLKFRDMFIRNRSDVRITARAVAPQQQQFADSVYGESEIAGATHESQAVDIRDVIVAVPIFCPHSLGQQPY